MCLKQRPKNEDRRPKTLWSKTKTHWSKTKIHWSKTKTLWSKTKTHQSKTFSPSRKKGETKRDKLDSYFISVGTTLVKFRNAVLFQQYRNIICHDDLVYFFVTNILFLKCISENYGELTFLLRFILSFSDDIFMYTLQRWLSLSLTTWWINFRVTHSWHLRFNMTRTVHSKVIKSSHRNFTDVRFKNGILVTTKYTKLSWQIISILSLRFRPQGLRFRPVGLRFRPQGLRFRPVGLRFRPQGLRFSFLGLRLRHILDFIHIS